MAVTRVSLAQVAAGALDVPSALTRDSAQYVAHSHHANVEASGAKLTFSSCIPVAGVAPGTVLAAAGTPFTLYNPIGSGVYLALVYASMGYVSGTLGAGTVYLAENPSTIQAAPSGGTLLARQCSFAGFTGGKGLAYTGATVAAVPSVVEPLFTIGAFLASTALIAPVLKFAWNGSHQLAPGAAYTLQAVAAAGSTPLVTFAVMWEEIPIPT